MTCHPEHLALVLISEDGAARQVIQALELDSGAIRDEILRNLHRDRAAATLPESAWSQFQAGSGAFAASHALQQDPRMKRVRDLACAEAWAADSGCISTAHLLIGLVREGGLLAQALRSRGVDLAALRQQTAKHAPEEVAESNRNPWEAHSDDPQKDEQSAVDLWNRYWNKAQEYVEE